MQHEPSADESKKIQRMIETIRSEARYCASMTGKKEISARVLEVMGQIPRHLFVPESIRHAAYDNAALPAGHGQTISQPFIVALMTDLLDLSGEERVLEVGTGTGYQTAILAHLAAEVFSIEFIPELAEQARNRLQQLGLMQGVHLRVGDGWQGWPEHAPYQGIIVTAAPDRIPPALIEQLDVGGRMVIPVGDQGYAQELQCAVKNPQGELEIRNVLPVAFVPMVKPDIS